MIAVFVSPPQIYYCASYHGKHRRKIKLPSAYRQTSIINLTKSQNLNVSRLVLQLSLPNILKPCIIKVENGDVVETLPTGSAPTTSEWSTILMPTTVRLILEVGRHTDTVVSVICGTPFVGIPPI